MNSISSAFPRLRRTALVSSAIFSLGMMAFAQPPNPPAAEGEKKSEAAPGDRVVNLKVDVAQLLANPIPAKEDFKYLYQRRRWLAANADNPANFEKLADELAEKGAYFASIELLWFADKMVDDQKKREAYQTKMKEWIEAGEEVNKMVEQGEQLAAAGRGKEALDLFTQAVKKNKYAERAHYQLANTFFRVYLDRAVEQENLMPLETRVKLFRNIYEEALMTLSIDPLFYDAHYVLGSARELLPDQPDFLVQTQPFSDRALKFRDEVIPALKTLEEGGREPETLVEFGAGLEAAGVPDYAVFAYQAALKRGSKDASLPGRIRALMEKYFIDKPK